MRRAGRFLWVDWAQGYGRAYASSDGERADCFQGEHDGYKRIGVTHRRTVRWLRGDGWVIVDDVHGAGTHGVRLHWLAADLPFEVADSSFQIDFKSNQSRLQWKIFSSVKGTPALIRAGKRIPIMNAESEIQDKGMQLLGWESTDLRQSSAGGFAGLSNTIAATGEVRNVRSYE